MLTIVTTVKTLSFAKELYTNFLKQQSSILFQLYFFRRRIYDHHTILYNCIIFFKPLFYDYWFLKKNNAPSHDHQSTFFGIDKVIYFNSDRFQPAGPVFRKVYLLSYFRNPFFHRFTFNFFQKLFFRIECLITNFPFRSISAVGKVVFPSTKTFLPQFTK